MRLLTAPTCGGPWSAGPRGRRRRRRHRGHRRGGSARSADPRLPRRPARAGRLLGAGSPPSTAPGRGVPARRRPAGVVGLVGVPRRRARGPGPAGPGRRRPQLCAVLALRGPRHDVRHHRLPGVLRRLRPLADDRGRHMAGGPRTDAAVARRPGSSAAPGGRGRAHGVLVLHRGLERRRDLPRRARTLGDSGLPQPEPVLDHQLHPLARRGRPRAARAGHPPRHQPQRPRRRRRPRARGHGHPRRPQHRLQRRHGALAARPQERLVHRLRDRGPERPAGRRHRAVGGPARAQPVRPASSRSGPPSWRRPAGRLPGRGGLAVAGARAARRLRDVPAPPSAARRPRARPAAGSTCSAPTAASRRCSPASSPRRRPGTSAAATPGAGWTCSTARRSTAAPRRTSRASRAARLQTSDRYQVAIGIAGSWEAAQIRLDGYYQLLLGRPRDPASVGWIPRMLLEADGDIAVPASVAGSLEYYLRAGAAVLSGPPRRQSGPSAGESDPQR